MSDVRPVYFLIDRRCGVFIASSKRLLIKQKSILLLVLNFIAIEGMLNHPSERSDVANDYLYSIYLRDENLSNYVTKR